MRSRSLGNTAKRKLPNGVWHRLLKYMGQVKVSAKLHRIKDTIDPKTGDVIKHQNFDEITEERKAPKPRFSAQLKKYRG